MINKDKPVTRPVILLLAPATGSMQCLDSILNQRGFDTICCLPDREDCLVRIFRQISEQRAEGYCRIGIFGCEAGAKYALMLSNMVPGYFGVAAVSPPYNGVICNKLFSQLTSKNNSQNLASPTAIIHAPKDEGIKRSEIIIKSLLEKECSNCSLIKISDNSAVSLANTIAAWFVSSLNKYINPVSGPARQLEFGGYI